MNALTEHFIYQAIERWGKTDGVDVRIVEYPRPETVATKKQTSYPSHWHIKIKDVVLSVLIDSHSYTGFQRRFRYEHPLNTLAEIYIIDAPVDYPPLDDIDPALGYQSVADIDKRINDILNA